MYIHGIFLSNRNFCTVQLCWSTTLLLLLQVLHLSGILWVNVIWMECYQIVNNVWPQFLLCVICCILKLQCCKGPFIWTDAYATPCWKQWKAKQPAHCGVCFSHKWRLIEPLLDILVYDHMQYYIQKIDFEKLNYSIVLCSLTLMSFCTWWSFLLFW